jgi:VIT1/CCC1 family predicted Fe2+/Mn2+ transporter
MRSSITRISFGSTAAIVTSMALITGLQATSVTKPIVIGALLIAAVADNLTDSLSIHMYQESEGIAQRQVVIGTVWNFLARLLGCLTFVLIVWICPLPLSVPIAIAWGMLLLSGLTFLLARERGASFASELAKHMVVAAIVLVASRSIAHWLS